MRFALRMIAIAMFVAACGQSQSSVSPAPHTSPTPHEVGTATLTETGCDFAMPDSIPMTVLSFGLVARTKYTAHFSVIRVDDGHTFKEMVDYWYAHLGMEARFGTLIAEKAVRPNDSDKLVATITLKGTYAFHCGYKDENGTVTGFFHELNAG